MAKEKNEHNDRYMALKRLKRHGTLYSQEKTRIAYSYWMPLQIHP